MGSPKRQLGTLEACAWSAGLLCLGLLLLFRVQASRAERASERLVSLRATAGEVGARPGQLGHREQPDLATYQGVIGRLEIPALKLEVPILNDYDPDSLRRGVGRMKGTGVPGGLGNLVLAGHRDTYFRPLRAIRKGMVMRVVTPDSVYDYAVDSTNVVKPDDVDVLDIGNRPEMTLITCYPFDFFGAAPKRFIVHTHLISVAGETR